MSMLFSRRNESLEQPSTTREPLISPLPAFLEEQSSAPPASRAFRAEPASPALPHKLPRRTKAHVASACVNCKKKHLGCDPARPCRRCVLSGKEATCIDVTHKKRGRPPLKAKTVSFQPSAATTDSLGECVSGIADLLFRELGFLHPDSEMIDTLSQSLPDLLKGFALKLQGRESVSDDSGIAIFVYNNCHEIATAFRDKWQGWRGYEPTDCSTDGLSASRKESVQNSHQDLWSSPPDGGAQPTAGFNEKVQAKEAKIQLMTRLREIIGKAPAYEWLIQSLRKELLLTPPGSNMIHFRDTIISDLLSTRPSAAPLSGSFTVLFQMRWDLLLFIQEQDYQEPADAVLEGALTLTGHVKNAQALPCAQYMRQTWPLTGGAILDLVKRVIGSGKRCEQSTTLFDGTKLTLVKAASDFHIKATGDPWSIAEVAEQLAWLGAALRPPFYTTALNLCTPSVSLKSLQRDPPHLATFEIEFSHEEQPGLLCPRPGECWKNLFNSHMVVAGYPILRRAQVDTGLEISLGIMAALVQARVTIFDGKVYLKGFCTMMIPTRFIDDVVLWHIIFNNKGEYVSYTDPQVHSLEGLYPDKLTMTQLQVSRHILGWCSNALNRAGSRDANYSIDWSGLLQPFRGFELERVFIHSGRIVQKDVSAVLGKRDRPAYFGSDVYLDRLKWISRKFVVLYDVTDKRGWLTDGASALLHLVRASLISDETGDFGEDFLLDWADVEEPRESGASAKAAAIAFLRNEQNKNLKLYGASDSSAGPAVSSSGSGAAGPRRQDAPYYMLKNRVEAIFYPMEQIITHQEQVGVARQMGFTTNQAPDALEGFDFMDVATGEDVFSARFTEIEPDCRGWVDFARSIHAVVLFGNGFGEIIQPSNAEDVCPMWASVPRGLDCLAACVSDIESILKRRGSSRANPWRLVDGIIWHSPERTFEPCQCHDGPRTEACNRVQVLFPDSWPGISGRAFVSPFTLIKNGAVIFGQGPTSLDFGRPETVSRSQGVSNPSKTSYSPSLDSGLGQSQGLPATTEMSEGPQPGQKRPSCDMETTLRSGKRRAVPLESGAMPNRRTEPSPLDYKVGWLCAIKPEFDAALAMLDATYDRGFGHGSDQNLYTLGRIGVHNVVITCLPMGRYGTNAAAVAATRMMNRFPNIQIGLMVGIGGGIPTARNDIRLGDIVVSKPESHHGGVIQYDMGKYTRDGFESVGYLNPPPEILLNALNCMPAHGTPLGIGPNDLFTPYPGEELDCLHTSDQLAPRGPGHRERRGPHVFYGTIASGNAIIKDATVRDRLVQTNGFLCVEMEAAGLMNSSFPCLVIRGISDYADSHKNDRWQAYAAAAAARYARAFLFVIPENLAVSNPS